MALVVATSFYYLFLASAIQRHRRALCRPWIIGTLPVVIAITAKARAACAGNARRVAPLRWRQMAPSLALIALGIALVKRVELERLRSTERRSRPLRARRAASRWARWRGPGT